MLESEAKTKICPFTIANRIAATPCIGSACMGWKMRKEFVRMDDNGVPLKAWVLLDPPEGDCGMRTGETP